MVWSLTIGGTPVHAYLNPLNSLRVQNKGYAGSTATLSCRLIDTSPYTINPALEQVVALTDPGGTKAFGGYLRTLGKDEKNVAGVRIWTITAQDYNTNLVDDYVPLGTVRNTVETDEAFVTWLITNFSTRGMTAPAGTVDQVLAGNITPLGDIGGMTLYAVLQLLNDQTGAKFWVDYDNQLHYSATANTVAPWDVDMQAPNEAAIPRPKRPVRNFSLPQDSIDFVNTVVVVGATRTDGVDSTVVYRGGSAPPAGTRRAVILEDPTITTLAEAQNKGAAALGGYTNRDEGRYETWYGGLRAGQMQHIKNTMYGIDADFPISQVEFVPLDAEQAKYVVNFGAQPVTLQTLIQDTNAKIDNAVALIDDRFDDIPGADPTPPPQVTGFDLTSSFVQAPDGTQWPVVGASWSASPAPDLDAYELELARAISGTVAFSLSASGTGGALTAGTYSVFVTGLGSAYGETIRSSPKEVTITAGQRIFVNITAKAGMSAYRVYVERNTDEPRLGRVAGQTSTPTTGSNVEVTAAGTVGDPTAPTQSTATDFASPETRRTTKTNIVVDGVQGGIVYIGRVRAVDKSGNLGAFSTVDWVVAQGDNAAPGVPQGLSAINAKGGVGLQWQRNPEPDVAHYGIRYSPDLAGAPDPEAWIYLTTAGTVVVITGLEVNATYHFQVRAVDTSGNVVTSDVDPTPVKADSNPSAGWTAAVQGTPGMITGDDIAAGTILANHISAAGLDASIITAGTLSVGGLPNTADFINVYNAAGQLVASINETAVEFRDPTNPLRRLRFAAGVLQFSENGGSTWTTSISADGIVADSIKLGASPGGHNAIPNASFELSAFSTVLSKIWTVTADWTATIGTDVNVDKSTAELRMSTVSY